MNARHLGTGAALLMLVLTGCEKKIKSSDLENKLKDELGQNSGVPIKSVDCPDDITAKKGKKFNCTLTTSAGERRTVNVTLTNDKGGFQALVPPQQ